MFWWLAELGSPLYSVSDSLDITSYLSCFVFLKKKLGKRQLLNFFSTLSSMNSLHFQPENMKFFLIR